MSETIFISIASYRDAYCTKTLDSIYSTAANPKNVYVGLCTQNNVEDEDCILKNDELKLYQPNIATIRLKSHEAKGPTWARYLCATLFNNQDYFLQIDSHTLFEKDWDTILINMINDIKKNTTSSDVVISHYPPNYHDINNKDRNVNMVDTICQSFFNENGMISFLGAEGIDMSKHKYVQTPHIAGGMFFCQGKCIKDVPYDPYLPKLFVGEEILHSARIWTSGYDIYSPTQAVVYHLYTRDDQPHVWDNTNYDYTEALNKVKKLMNLQEDEYDDRVPEYLKDNIDKYGLGKKRTLQEYYDFAGIDIKNKKIYKNFCPTPHEIDSKNSYTEFKHKNINKNKIVEYKNKILDYFSKNVKHFYIIIGIILFIFILFIIFFIFSKKIKLYNSLFFKKLFKTLYIK